MSDDAQVWTDYEFHFTHGEPLFVSVLEGRDAVTPPVSANQPWEITLHESDDLTSTVTVYPWRLNGMRETRRVVPSA